MNFFLQNRLDLAYYRKDLVNLLQSLFLVSLINFVNVFYIFWFEVDLSASITNHKYTGMYDSVVSDYFFLSSQLMLILKFSQLFVLQLFDRFEQKLPAIFGRAFLINYLLLIVLHQIIGEISAEIIKSSCVNRKLFDIFALVLNIDLLFPAVGLHRIFDNLKSRTNVGDMFYNLFQFLNLRTILVKQFVKFSEVVSILFVKHYILEVFKLDCIILYLMQIFSRNVVFLHLRSKALKVELQFINMLLWQLTVAEFSLKFILVVYIILTLFALYLSQLFVNQYLQLLGLLLVKFLQLLDLLLVFLNLLLLNRLYYQQLLYCFLIIKVALLVFFSFNQLCKLLHLFNVFHTN